MNEPLSKIKLVRMAIVGPESTGKSELAAALAAHYKAVWVPEFARNYLEALNRDYEYNDLKQIAEGQVQSEDELAKGASRLLFCDTNLTVIKIWSEFKYGKCDDWILNEIKTRKYDLHLLTDVDLPWQSDPQREHPDQRNELFDLYVQDLKQQQVVFELVSGIGHKRIENAIGQIEKHIVNHEFD